MKIINFALDIVNIIIYNDYRLTILIICNLKGGENMKINSEKFELAMSNAVIGTKQLSILTDLSQETIARIKNGRQNPRPMTLGKIAKALNVKVEDLVE